MKTYYAWKASAIGEGEVESAQLVMQQEIASDPTLEQMADMHDNNADAVCQALSHLPQGTLDKVMLRLMESRACLLRVQDEKMKALLRGDE